MRARLLVVVQVLVALLAVGLGVPLALADAQAEQLDLFTDQLTDTIAFASLAERPIVEGRPDAIDDLAAELRIYDEVYGVAVQVLDGTGAPLASSRTDAPVLDADAAARVEQAGAGRRSEPYPLLMPWDDRPLVLAEPVLVDTEVRGVALTVTSTAALHARQAAVWLLVTAAGVVALLAAAAVAVPMVRWILRPVRRLDEGTGRVAAAVLAGADPEPVADGTGPAELRRLSASFDRMAETVGRAYAAQRRFVADASHQLRNPLTALRLRLSNLDGRLAPDAVDDHLAALEEAERLSTLLDGLLALARAERTVPLVEVDLDAAVADRAAAWRPLAEHTGLTLVVTGTRGLRIRAAESAVATVLDAVLDNAVKYSPPGGRITVQTRRVSGTGDSPGRAEEVELAVRDHGPGLDPAALALATDRFWRAPGQSNVEGSGLGLAIAARTTELSGGRLRLELPGGGGLQVVARFAAAVLPAPGR